MCQGFSHFSGFLHHSVLAKLATSSIRVEKVPGVYYIHSHHYLLLPNCSDSTMAARRMNNKSTQCNRTESIIPYAAGGG